MYGEHEGGCCPHHKQYRRYDEDASLGGSYLPPAFISKLPIRNSCKTGECRPGGEDHGQEWGVVPVFMTPDNVIRHTRNNIRHGRMHIKIVGGRSKSTSIVAYTDESACGGVEFVEGGDVGRGQR